jgi:excinuclease ABC subunit C
MPNYQLLITNYRKNIRAIKDILKGKRISLVRRLEKEMTGLGKSGDYEKAIELRGRIERVKRVFENAQIIRNLRGASRASAALEQLQTVLALPSVPLRIEGYDISNIQGIYATGSMVTFVDGQRDKNFYRKFKIKTVSGSNDTAMLREVLSRRLNHPEWPFPDLIIIDGGKGQLNAAIKTLEKLKETNAELANISVIALTKNDRHRGEEIIYRTENVYKVIELKKLPEQARNLILTVDSESHRFAISYYRTLHRTNLRK